MAQQQYIKHLYEQEECSIAGISRRVGINWRTAAKYAKKDDWNQPMQQTRRRQPVMGSFVDIVDTWLMEDMLKPRKERRTAATIYRQLREQYGFKGSGRTVRAYVSRRKKELRTEAQEKYLRLEHPPGQAQVDFGTSHVVWDGVLREIKYLTFSFPYSNAGFCVPVPSENTECLLYAMILVFEWIGGVPPEIWFDNLSAAVVGVGKGEQRELTETFRRFMLHYVLEEVAKYPAEDSALIRHKLYRITFPDAPLEALNETYTPDSVRRYTPEINIYDRLVPQAGGKGGELRDQVVVEGAV